MSPDSSEEVDVRRFGGVDGNDITLTEKRTAANNKVIEFNLRNNDRLLGIQLNLLLFCLTLFLGNLANSLTLVTLSVVALALHCRHTTASVDFDTLLVVESVGIQISSKKIFAGFNSSQFLPWTTVEDVFINEVITGQRVLYCLTFVVQEFVNGKQRTRLVPLFRELKPSKKCLEYIETKEFFYKDELMKVIKRIIKCRTIQGQLSTSHLSVTCKHTFWTRQDKMFAKMKFRNRHSASVFPQAFILTISVLEDPMASQITETVIKAEPGSSYADNSAVQSPMIPHGLVKTELSNEIVSKRPKDDADRRRTFGLSNYQTDTVVFHKSNKSTNPDRFLKNSEPLGSTTPSSVRNRNNGKRRHSLQSQREIIVMDTCTMDLAADAVPPSIIISNGQKDRSESLLADPLYYNSNKKTTTIGDAYRKNGDKNETGIDSLESFALRSSDITDQVMEGLMFTIRQDKDNVKVLEQRTKMELDEVLENSEKVETKEGERCLVNSSLLRLENLVTKIETQDKRIMDSKTNHPISRIDSLALFPRYSLPEPVTNGQANYRGSLRNSLKAGDQASNMFFPLAYAFVPIELANLDAENTSQGSTNLVDQILNGQQKRKFESPSVVGKRMRADEFKGSNADNPTNENANNSDNNELTDNNNRKNVDDSQVPIDMWKLLQDISRGAKVMVERISDIDIINATRSSTLSVSAATRTTRRTLPRSRK